jgi:hypothetical protein
MRNDAHARPGGWQARGRAQAAAHGGGAVTSILREADVAYNAAGRPVGRFVRDGDGRLWLEKRNLDPAQHLLRSPRGWATDTAHLDELRRRGGAGVRLHDITGRTWTATLAQFDRHGIQFDRGFGKQTVLPERFWHLDAPGTRQLELFSLLAADTGGAGGAA